MYDHIRGLAARGHQVETWSPPTAANDFLSVSGHAREHFVPLRGLAAFWQTRVGWVFRPYFGTVRLMRYMEEHCRACAAEMERGEFDLVLAHPCQYFRTSPIGRHVRRPSVIYLQEPYRELYEARPRLPWTALPRPERTWTPSYLKAVAKDPLINLGNRHQAREEADWARAFDRILVNSYFSRENVMRTYGFDSRVCYLGIDVAHFTPGEAAKEPFVVGLGNIASNKGIELAIEAVGHVPAERRPELQWVGNFADRLYVEKLQRLAERLQVRFTPKVLIPDSELIRVLQTAAAMIYTPLLEPFGYAPLEANACGTAAVVVAEGGIRETVLNGINGVVVSHRDPRALGQAVDLLTSDLSHAAEFGLRARRHVETVWNLPASIDRIEEQLLEVVGLAVSGRRAV